jgi:hypothetical protein
VVDRRACGRSRRAAIDEDLIVRSQEQHGLGDFLGFAEARNFPASAVAFRRCWSIATRAGRFSSPWLSKPYFTVYY